MIYCQAKYMRGAGLGTRLFTWARCVIFSYATETPMLAANWVQPRLGPLMRGGIDLRAYPRQILLLGLFKSGAEQVSGWRKWSIHMRGTHIGEPARLDQPHAALSRADHRPVIVTFEGAGNMFEDLNGWNEFLCGAIRGVTKERWLRVVEHRKQFPIGINIRMGNDFRPATSHEDYFTKGAIKTPLDWFIQSLLCVREAVGQPTPAIIVSDGTEQDLAPVLALDNVSFARPGCAISDLLTLAQCKILIGSGASSFSAWAAFLGQMPAISHPGQPFTWFRLKNQFGNFVGEFDPLRPRSDFLDQASAILRSGE